MLQWLTFLAAMQAANGRGGTEIRFSRRTSLVLRAFALVLLAWLAWNHESVWKAVMPNYGAAIGF